MGQLFAPRCCCVGSRENVLTSLPQIEHYTTFSDPDYAICIWKATQWQIPVNGLADSLRVEERMTELEMIVTQHHLGPAFRYLIENYGNVAGDRRTIPCMGSI